MFGNLTKTRKAVSAWTASVGMRKLKYLPLSGEEIRLVKFLQPSSADTIDLELVHQAGHFDIRRVDRPKSEVAQLYRRDPEELVRYITISKIECRVRYVCLSYCWGHPRKSRSITVNGCKFKITENLHRALQAIYRHHHHETYYWIDAICINQGDIVERSRQVAQMWKIFASAVNVLAWLGEADEESKIAIDAIKHYGLFHGPRNQHSVDSHIATAQEKAAIKRLTERQYFIRTWIQQEVLQARTLSFICGEMYCDGEDLAAFCSFHRDAVDLVASRLMRHFYYREPRSTTGGGCEFRTCVETYFDTLCSDIRDRIFAMLGDTTLRRLDPETILKPDYSIQIDELFLELLLFYERIVCDDWQLVFNSLIDVLDLVGHGPCLSFRKWFFNRKAWDYSNLPERLKTRSGRIYDCSGPLIRSLLMFESTSAASDSALIPRCYDDHEQNRTQYVDPYDPKSVIVAGSDYRGVSPFFSHKKNPSTEIRQSERYCLPFHAI
ncbi:Heterokaryon incompatibility protein 6, OR allele [Pseudocercospora fuligena]|uniref:Heterokaryon incompatibility protein 6, OR allele n=1 Tax=Pseudocercospora fuligena TaxID=685502 RepID=A0A8H6RWN8_9PEZI|nr:Heterokaryon incompatibility protein 6, OR allele [Pseudocercospora fuligena]